MAIYTKQTCVEKVTPAGPAYMNHIQDGIVAVAVVAEQTAAGLVAETERAEAVEALLGATNPPGIVNPGPQSGEVGVAREVVIVATGATSFKATGLPLGMVIDAVTGRIKGTPTTVETTTVVVTATGQAGSNTTTFIFTIAAATAPTVTKPADQTAVVGTPVSLQIVATGATEYKATGLPAGVSINAATGKITGTPSTVETPETTVTVKGPGGEKATKFKWAVTAAVALPAIRTGGVDPEAEATATTIKAPEPVAGTMVGDMLIMLVKAEHASVLQTVTTPAGWSKVGTAGAIGFNAYYVFEKINDGAAMPTLTASAAVAWTVRMLSVQVNPGAEVNVVGGFANKASSASFEIASVTTTVNAALVIALESNQEGRGMATPGGWALAGPYKAKNTMRPIVKTQALAGATGAATVALEGGNAATTTLVLAIAPGTPATGMTDKLALDERSVEPVALPGGTANIRVELATAEVGQGENSIFSVVEASTTNVFGTSTHPWVALQALNASFEPIGPFTPRRLTTPAAVAPVVTKPANRSGNVSKADSLQVAATGSPTEYKATGLPTGMSINGATGLITGTPSAVGVVTVKLTAKNAAGTSVAVEFTWTIAAAVTALAVGLVMNSDSTSSPSLVAVALCRSGDIIRDQFGIATAAATVKERAEFFASHNVLLQPLASFQARIPTAGEAKGLAAWASALATLAIPPKYIEFGNETNYQITNNKANGELYGARAKEAADAILATGTGIKLLVQGSDAGKAGNTEWLDGILTAWPKAWEHAAFGGWTIHAYPGSHVQGETDTFGVPMMERMVKRLEEHGDLTSRFFNTEWGVPSTSNGRTMTSGQSMNWAEGANVCEVQKPRLEIASKGKGATVRLEQLLVYQPHDQHVDDGTDTEREHFFGVVQSEGAAKGGYTTFSDALL